MSKDKINIFIAKDWKDYELLDTGGGEKLERFGQYFFVRPYEDAFWPKTLKNSWQNITGRFKVFKESLNLKRKRNSLEQDASPKKEKNGWKFEKEIPDRFELSYKNVKFFASPTPFRHLGFFPEQAVHWDYIEEKIKKVSEDKKKKGDSSPVRFLNLFGYTGVASLFALKAGAEVTHVDASKQTLTWAKDNQKLSKMENLPMRIICEDVLKFVEREVRRGNKYDCIIMDPPKFGRGPKGEIWKIEESLPHLLNQVEKLLSDTPIFLILNSYATDSSSLSLGYTLENVMENRGGVVLNGELCLQEKSNNRAVSLSNVAIWEGKN